jgi:hypothetical protein
MRQSVITLESHTILIFDAAMEDVSEWNRRIRVGGRPSRDLRIRKASAILTGHPKTMGAVLKHQTQSNFVPASQNAVTE